MAPLQVIFAGFCSAAAVLSVQFFVLTSDRLLLLFGAVIAAGALVQMPFDSILLLAPAIAAFLAAQGAFAWAVSRTAAADRRLFWSGYVAAGALVSAAVVAAFVHANVARTLFESAVLVQAAFLAVGLALRYAELDPLTGVKSRRIFDQRLISSWKRAKRDGAGLALILVSADGVRRYESERGRLEAEALLRRVASLCLGCCRSRADMFARYGDESFAAIIPRATRQQANDIGARMREVVGEGCLLPIGVGVSSIENAISHEALLQQAARRSAREAIANGMSS